MNADEVNSSAPSKAELVAAMQMAVSSAVTALFREHADEHFYYCALVTTGEALSPNLSAWSTEALDAAVVEYGNEPNARLDLKWSYADSPYCFYGEEYFEDVRRLFDVMDRLGSLKGEVAYPGYAFRMEAMEEAMSRLDKSGLFGRGSKRDGIVINVECIPPDWTNTERAIRLNPPEALKEWLREAAESG